MPEIKCYVFAGLVLITELIQWYDLAKLGY